MSRYALSLAAAVCVSPSLVHAQSLNIDFGSGAGVPSETYAGAGSAGRWNVISVVPPTPVSLVGLDSGAIPAHVLVDSSGDAATINDPGTLGDDQALLDDFLAGVGDVFRRFTFSSLAPGHYRVITYGWTPRSPGDSTAIFVNDRYGQYQEIGGAWPGHLAQGVTHAVHYADVTAGELVITVTGGSFGDSGNVNGIQLVRLGPPCPVDWNLDGAVDSQDLFDFVPQFFANDADFNGDGVINSRDFFAFLAAFFAGC